MEIECTRNSQNNFENEQVGQLVFPDFKPQDKMRQCGTGIKIKRSMTEKRVLKQNP